MLIVLLAFPLWLQAQVEQKGDTLQKKMVQPPPIQLRMDDSKPWIGFDESMPQVFGEKEAKPQQRYTLHPYTPWTPYDWDPVYKKKIAVGKDTWRGPYWKMLHVSDIKGMTNTGHIKLEKKESLVRFENGMLVGDYATLLTQYFTREFWRFRAKKNRKDTKEALEEMGRTLSDEH